MQIHIKYTIVNYHILPLHIGDAMSPTVSEVKQRWVWSIFGWVTAWLY